MNKLGVHAAVWVGGWSRSEAERAISKTAELGFDIIEIPALDPAAIDVAMTRDLLEQHGLEPIVSLGLSPDTDISSPDPHISAAGEKRLMAVLELARQIGAKRVSGILYSALLKYQKSSESRGIENSVNALRRVCEAAAESDTLICLEAVNRYETNMLNTAAQTREFCERIGAENVAVHLDCYHMNIEERSIAAAIRDAGPRLGYFHTGDSYRGYLGTGTVDLRAAFRALVDVGYKGPITFEAFSTAVMERSLSDVLAIWRNVWEDGEDLCRHARAFTLAELQAASRAAMADGT